VSRAISTQKKKKKKKKKKLCINLFNLKIIIPVGDMYKYCRPCPFFPPPASVFCFFTSSLSLSSVSQTLQLRDLKVKVLRLCLSVFLSAYTSMCLRPSLRDMNAYRCTYIWTYIWILETLASLRFLIFAFSIRSCISLAFYTIGAAIWAVVLDLEVSVSLIVFHMFIYACLWMWIFVN
jgi:hypothetical protein